MNFKVYFYLNLKERHLNNIDYNYSNILIKIPKSTETIFCFFPALIFLHDHLPNANYFLICEEGEKLAFDFLPFKVKVFERPSKRLNLFETHKFCKNLNEIFNIDLFLDFENSFNSSFLGFHLCRQERVGLKSGINNLFLTKKYNSENLVSKEQLAISLVEFILQKKSKNEYCSAIDFSAEKVKKEKQLFKEQDTQIYLFVMLDNFDNFIKFKNNWIKVFENFSNNKIIIWSLKDKNLISNEILKFENNISKSCFFHSTDLVNEIYKIFSNANGIICNNFWSESLLNYLGLEYVSYYFEEENKLNEFQYIKCNSNRFIATSSDKFIHEYQNQKKVLENLNHSIDHVHMYFKI